MTIDHAKLDEFVGKFAGDMGAVLHAATVLVGDRLGIYKAMADSFPVTPAQLSDRTGHDERYLLEWLSAQAAAGYAQYDPDDGTFRLTEEQAFALTSETNPVFVPGGLQIAASTIRDTELLAEAIKDGRGVDWSEHHRDLSEGTDRFFKPSYIGNLVTEWIPALDGVAAKLEAGARVADVGCGFGAPAILIAREYEHARVFGSDYDAASIEAARKAAADDGVADRCTFEVASAKDYSGEGYDLVTFFDCLHDMGDPLGAARHVRQSLADDGTWMIVEPNAGDRLEDNLNPVGRIFYSASTLICVPTSKSQEVGLALGAQAGERRIREIAEGAGFTRFRRATENPFNVVYEARP